ncbi:MAG: carbohydrate binding domain-containing protein, partial [Flavobacterium sp.]
MKKITLFISIFSMTLGFSQNLITNGDFESGAAGWSGNALNVVTEGGNSYNAANVTVAGNPWDVNLSYVLNIPTVGVNYQLTFTAWSNTNRPLIAGIGLNQPDWTNTTQTVNLTSTPQTFTLNLTSNFANANSRIIFDMGNAVGFVGIDDVILTLNTGGGGDPNELPIILDFETPSEFTFAGFEGLGGVAIVPDPAAGGTNGDGFQMIHASTGNPWQGAEVVLAGNKRVRLTTNKTMQLDVYSTQAFNLLLKVEVGADPSATAASYTTPGEWQTLTFNFNVPMDGTG